MDDDGGEFDEAGQVEQLGELGATSEVLLGLLAKWFDGQAPDWTNTTALDLLQAMYAWLMTFEPGWRAQGRDPGDGWSVFRHALLAGPRGLDATAAPPLTTSPGGRPLPSPGAGSTPPRAAAGQEPDGAPARPAVC